MTISYKNWKIYPISWFTVKVLPRQQDSTSTLRLSKSTTVILLWVLFQTKIKGKCFHADSPTVSATTGWMDPYGKEKSSDW